MPRLRLTVAEPGLWNRFPSTTAGIRTAFRPKPEIAAPAPEGGCACGRPPVGRIESRALFPNFQKKFLKKVRSRKTCGSIGQEEGNGFRGARFLSRFATAQKNTAEKQTGQVRLCAGSPRMGATGRGKRAPPRNAGALRAEKGSAARGAGRRRGERNEDGSRGQTHAERRAPCRKRQQPMRHPYANHDKS